MPEIKKNISSNHFFLGRWCFFNRSYYNN